MTDDLRATLEAELLAVWSDHTAAIYADHLQAAGDPRGELIMLDLRGGATANRRRGELLEAWLGRSAQLWWSKSDRTWYAGDPDTTWVTFDRGLVEILFLGPATWCATEHLIKLLDGPAGRFVRRFAVSGECDTLRTCLRAISRHRQPWLRHLAIRRLGYDGEVLVGETLERQLLDAAPRLDLLDVTGQRVLARFVHPTMHELRIVGRDAVDLELGPAMPAVRTLDFAYDALTVLDPMLDAGELARMLTVRRFPGLRQLRLWREEPGVRVFPFLADLDLLPRLHQLALPALCRAADLAMVQGALNRMPELRTLEIARAYASVGDFAGQLRHPSARIVLPPLRPWPPPHRGALWQLEIERIFVDLREAIELMEEQYDDLPADARAAWDELWLAVARLDHDELVVMPRRVLLRALAAVDGLDECPSWSLLRARLDSRPLAASSVVTLQRR